MNIKELISIFRKKADKYYLESEFLNEEIELYQNIIDDLENKKISLRAQKLLYEKYRLNLSKYNVEVMLETIKTDLFVLKSKVKIVNEKYKLCRYALHSLGYGQVAEPKVMKFIKEELEKSNITGEVLVKTMEKVKIHNANITYHQKKAIKSDDLFLILNMLNQGYEDIPKVKNKNKEKLDGIVAKLNSVIDGNTLQEMTDNFKLDEMYGNTFNEEDFKYIYTETLRHIQRRIIELVDLLKEPEYYFQIEMLNTIKDEYKDYYNKYMFIRGKLDSLSLKENDDKEQKDIPVLDIISGVTNNLYYSTNSLEASKCYFMRDLMIIREESLEKIWKLIQNFKNGEKVNLKHLKGGSGTYFEIKEDQIRIILKSINNNNYSVIGVFIKKSNSLIGTYQLMFNRPNAEINDEYSVAVEEEIAKYVKENARKGSR